MENRLNELPGVWATVSLEKRRARLRMKSELPEMEFFEAVERAGYTARKMG